MFKMRCGIPEAYILDKSTRVNQKVKAVFKLRGNRDIEELPHYAVLAVSVEEFNHVQYSALASVEWQQRGRNHWTLLCKIASNYYSKIASLLHNVFILKTVMF